MNEGFYDGCMDVSAQQNSENNEHKSHTISHSSRSSGAGALIVSFWSIFWTICWTALIILLLLRIFVFQQVNVVGSSMEPNYYTDQRLVVNRRNKNFVRGQVVAAYSDPEVAKNATPLTPYSPQTRFFLKRIIALPGESIEIVGVSVVIYNDQFPEGRILEEDYLSDVVRERQEAVKEYYPKTKIPEGYYFLLGDNRANSQDSRNPSTGPFPEYSIFGQETLRYWPLNTAEWFEVPQYSYSPIDREFERKRQDIVTANMIAQPVIKKAINP